MAFGPLTKRPIDTAVTGAWLDAFLADGDVRADVTAFLRAIDKNTLLDASARLTAFDKPVLLAWASEDRVFPPEHAQRMAARFQTRASRRSPTATRSCPRTGPSGWPS